MRTTLALLVAAAMANAAPKPLPRLRPAEEQMMRGDAWSVAGRCDEAVKPYRKAVALDPKNGLYKVRLAGCLARIGQRDDAIAMLDAIAAAPGPAGILALQVRADLAVAAGDLAGAVAAYDKLLARAPIDPLARTGLLEALAALAKKGDAAAKARALELAAAWKDDRLATAMVRAHATRIEAILKWGEAGEALLLARTKLAIGDPRGAVALLERAVAERPELEEAQYLLGVAYATSEVGRKDDARRAWKKAPHVKEALHALAVDAYEGDDLAGAEKFLDQAVKLDERYQSAWYQLGLVHKEGGRAEQAKGAWRRAIAIDPRSELGRWASTKLQVLTGNINSLSEGQVIDPSSEVGIGQQLAKRIEEQFGRMEDPALHGRLDRILKRLASVSDRPGGEVRWKVVLVDVPMVNALTVPGGTILVFRGLADLIKKRLGDGDDAWATILGHECAHAALRHGLGMVQVASSLSAGRAFSDGPGGLATLLNTVSRAHEFEADQFGALYAYRAGFDPATSMKVFESMLAEMGEIPRGMNHPTHRERIDRLRDYLLDVRGKVRGFDLAVKALGEGQFDDAAERFEVFLGVFPSSPAARSNLGVSRHRKALAALPPSTRFRRATDVDPNARAKKIVLRGAVEAAKPDERLLREAVVEYDAALAIDPSYPTALVNLGAALDDLKEPGKARDALERAVRLAPESKEAWNNLGAVAAGAGDNARAVSALTKAIALDGKYAEAWFNLALVHEQAGHGADAAKAWDTFLGLDVKSGWADLARKQRAAIK